LIEETSPMNDLPSRLLADSSAFLREYMAKIDASLGHLDDRDVWWRPHETFNSIGNLLLHLDGSTRWWVLGVAGGQPVERDRPSEFAERRHIPVSALLARLHETIDAAVAVIENLEPSTLLEHRRTRAGEDVTVLWAILHAVEHFSMHSGQIILLTKLRTGDDLRLEERVVRLRHDERVTRQ
jgi:uncharacterized damage-inducible protein DinB